MQQRQAAAADANRADGVDPQFVEQPQNVMCGLPE